MKTIFISSPVHVHEQETNPPIKAASGPDDLAFHFSEALRLLDGSFVEPYIPENLLLQDMEKYTFLAFLKTVFDNTRLQCRGSLRAEPAVLHCLHCNRGRLLKAYAYYDGSAEIPFARLGFVMETDEQGYTMDIYICNLFTSQPCSACA